MRVEPTLRLSLTRDRISRLVGAVAMANAVMLLGTLTSRLWLEMPGRVKWLRFQFNLGIENNLAA